MKVLFLIHDLGQGGAEKVLVNLVNHMDPMKFDVTVCALFGGGVNEQYLKPHIRYYAVFPKEIPGNSKLMKLLTPKQLHKLCVREHYDIEVSYLEGPSARVISGCTDKGTKLVSWIHVEQHNMKKLAASFRSEQEAVCCYNRFNRTVCVSEYVKRDFCGILQYDRPAEVLYNTVESQTILEKAAEPAPEVEAVPVFKLAAVGTLKESKGYDRLLRCITQLRRNGYPLHLFILGIGPLEEELRKLCSKNNIDDAVTFLGYQTNPYKYVAKCDLFVCASHAEGFSTAATEALIVGTPVCTVDVSGMKEMLGENDEYGVVTENSEEALCEGIKGLLDDPEKLEHYRKQASIRGNRFSTEATVRAVEEMLIKLL